MCKCRAWGGSLMVDTVFKNENEKVEVGAGWFVGGCFG
jgi:hypothetical protein